MPQKKSIPVTVIVTILNESTTINGLLQGLQLQTVLPREVVIVDGGSSDDTIQIIKQAQQTFPTKLRIFQKIGNRSVGRNTAIQMATENIIASTDAGCIPEPSWLAELYKMYSESHAPVVAGYYRGKAITAFEEAVIPYALVMPDKVNENNFLPATRSMLFEKKVWKTIGGFDEKLSDNEDYAFAHKIKARQIPITFTKHAIVIWKPRSTVRDFFIMIQRFAKGDIQAGIFRPKVISIYIRYLVSLLIFISLLNISTMGALLFLLIAAVVYTSWAIYKNLTYVPHGWYWLPVLQFVSDGAVLWGSTQALVKYHLFK